jgi:hypothetical protein
LGWEEKIALETEKFYVKGEYARINSQLFVKPKSLLSRICLHGYEHSGLQRQAFNRNIIPGPLNIKRVKGKEIIILKVRDDDEMNSFTVPDDWFLKNVNY